MIIAGFSKIAYGLFTRTAPVPPATPLLSFREVWVEYGDKVVLERVSLDVAEGEFVSVIGPSGAGKSTFLRLILGQEGPSRGQVLLDGVPLAPECSPDRGVVFQRYSVFPHLTALGSVREQQPVEGLGE